MSVILSDPSGMKVQHLSPIRWHTPPFSANTRSRAMRFCRVIDLSACISRVDVSNPFVIRDVKFSMLTPNLSIEWAFAIGPKKGINPLAAFAPGDTTLRFVILLCSVVTSN